MALPHSVRLYALCAPGRRLTVTASGKSYVLPDTDDLIDPLPSAVLSPKEIGQAIFEETRVALIEAINRIGGTEIAMRAAVMQIVEGQKEGIEQIKEVLKMPSVPIYNDAGKLIAAQRVESLEKK